MPFGVHASHAPEVLREEAIVDELRQCGLRRDGRVPVGQLLRLAQRSVQRLRCDKEPEPERWQERLRERADVEHAAGPVEALERLERTAAVADSLS